MTATAIPRGKPPVAPVVVNIPIDRIETAENVRADLGDVAELAASIRELGILQPLRVRALGDSEFRLVFGHRRLAAAAVAGLTHVPAVVDTSPADPARRTVEQLVENIQRADLNPLEEARALKAILDAEPTLTQKALGERIGRSQSYVANQLRILELDPKVLPLVESGQLSGAHAKALASLKGKPQRDYAEGAVRDGFSAHELERRIGYYHDDQKRKAEEAAKLATWAEQTAEPALVAKGADKATAVLTTVDGYGYGSEDVLNALKARGWKVGTTRSFTRGSGKHCTCEAFGIQQTWEGKAQVVRRCIVEKHYTALQASRGGKPTVSWQETQREYARKQAALKALREAVRPVFLKAFAALPADVARILLWSAMDYSLNDWVRDHKGDRKKPDAWAELTEQTPAQLAEDLVTYVFRDFDDRYNVKLDLEAIAESFGAHAKVAVAKGRKAAADA